MKNTIFLAYLLLSIIAGTAAFAQGNGGKKAQKPQAKLGTSFRLDGSTLRGKYQSSLGTNATVENDKYLDDLLGGRKSFSDRTQKDDQRN